MKALAACFHSLRLSSSTATTKSIAVGNCEGPLVAPTPCNMQTEMAWCSLSPLEEAVATAFREGTNCGSEAWLPRLRSYRSTPQLCHDSPPESPPPPAAGWRSTPFTPDDSASSSPMSSSSPSISSPVSTLQRGAFSPRQAVAVLRSLPVVPGWTEPRALCGLQNLGNTCFMNACIQCLSNSPPLALFFLKHSTVEFSEIQRKARSMELSTSMEDKAVYGHLSSLGRCGCECRRRTVGGNPCVSPPRMGLAGGCSCGSTDVGRPLPMGVFGTAGAKGLRRSSSYDGVPVGGLAESFGSLIRTLWSGAPMSAVSPKAVVGSMQSFVPRFAGYRQHDSQEFLRSLVDKLDHDCSRVVETPKYRNIVEETENLPEAEQARAAWDYHQLRHNSAIQDIFCGQLQSTIECDSCHRKSHCFDPFLDLSLPIPKPVYGRRVNIQDCLSSFAAEEHLEGQNAYHCSHCKSEQPATKRLSVFRFPSVLVLHIKRISSPGLLSFQKDPTFVQFDLEGLDLAPYLSPSAEGGKGPRPVYDLHAVTNHMGGMSSGHYTAYCKNVDDGSWYLYNDSSVSPVPKSVVNSPAAYVLFYLRRDC